MRGGRPRGGTGSRSHPRAGTPGDARCRGPGTRTSAARLPNPQQRWAGAHEPGCRRRNELGVGAASAARPSACSSRPAIACWPMGDRPSAAASGMASVPSSPTSDTWTWSPLPGSAVAGFGMKLATRPSSRASARTICRMSRNASVAASGACRQQAHLVLPRAVLPRELMNRHSGGVESVEDAGAPCPASLDLVDREHPPVIGGTRAPPGSRSRRMNSASYAIRTAKPIRASRLVWSCRRARGSPDPGSTVVDDPAVRLRDPGSVGERDERRRDRARPGSRRCRRRTPGAAAARR